MRITEFASLVGVTSRTIRHWEKEGVLPEADRDPSGSRTYADGDVRSARWVRSLRSAGLSLSEIRGFHTARPDQDVLNLVEARLKRERDLLDAQLEEIVRFRRVSMLNPVGHPVVEADVEMLIGLETATRDAVLKVWNRRGGEQPEWYEPFLSLSEEVVEDDPVCQNLIDELAAFA